MRFELSRAEVRQIADICVVIGEICLGSVVVPLLFSASTPILAAVGLLSTCATWVGSVYLGAVTK